MRARRARRAQSQAGHEAEVVADHARQRQQHDANPLPGVELRQAAFPHQQHDGQHDRRHDVAPAPPSAPTSPAPRRARR